MHTPASLPLTRDCVLIGGGHAHALVLKKWGMAPLPGVRLTVINPAPTAPYTGMLPGFVAGLYTRDALEIDLIRLARFAGARVILGHATGIDRAARMISVTGHPDIRYDTASLDIGITSSMPDLPGFMEHAVAAKPLGPFASRWTGFLAQVAKGDLPPEVVILGGGVAGVELSLAMAHRLRAEGASRASVTILEAGPAAMRDTSPGAVRALKAHLDRLGVTVRTGARSTEITATGVTLDTGETIPAAFVTGAAGARPHDWLARLDLPHRDGFLLTDDALRTADPALYAVGDCAEIKGQPRAKAGVYAVRQAPVLHDNMRADLTGSQRRPFRAQKDYLKLISTGHRNAVADKFGRAWEGPWLWKLKDGIDAKFMRGLGDLKPMAPPSVPADAALGVKALVAAGPICAGCGGKVAQSGLRDALARLPAPARPDVLTGPGDDAAILRTGDARQIITTDHLRAFLDDPYRFARIATVHAMGDAWAMGAAPQAVLASVILPAASDAIQSDMLREVMLGVSDAARAAGADVVGGHSATGADLSLGLTVTGLLPEAPILPGARVGDMLILTKPLGSGTLLAADMRLKVQGDDLAHALIVMERPLAEEARILGPVAHGMTDVTGFGLAGHLATLLGGLGAEIDLAALPLLPGALECAAAGVRSSLWASNRAATPVMGTSDDDPRAALLHDPQTAGGLLAAVPAGALNGLMTELSESAVVIGTVMEAPGLRLRV